MKRIFPELVLFSLFLVLNVATAFFYNWENEIRLMLPIRLGAAFINGMGVSLLMIWGVKCIRKYARIDIAPFLIGLMWILFVVECFLLSKFYTLLTPSVVMVLLETNHSEASEFFASYFDVRTLGWGIFILLLSAWGFCQRKKILSLPFPVCFQKRIVVWSVCLMILISYIGLTYYVTQIRHMTSYQMLTGIERLYYSFKVALNDRLEYAAYKEMMSKDLPVVTKNRSDIPYVVVILGESLSKWHMGAYGYALPTTPYLDRRIKGGETCRFDSVTTPCTVTSQAIRRIMTFYSDSADKPWFNYYTLPAVMRAAGYYTCWLSNQDSFTNGDNNSTAGIASTSSVVEFAHQRHASEERYGYFDGDLLPLFEKHLAKNDAKKFICLHLMGAHRRYTNRYPVEFSKFGIDDIGKKAGRETKRTISEYDNAVLYNDFVCEEVVRRLVEKDAIVFCFPDHGEEVYDTRNMAGHSLENPSAPMQNIPFWIWTSDRFNANRPGWMQRIGAKKTQPFNTADFIHTVMDICGIETEQYQGARSLFYSED